MFRKELLAQVEELRRDPQAERARDPDGLRSAEYDALAAEYGPQFPVEQPASWLSVNFDYAQNIESGKA